MTDKRAGVRIAVLDDYQGVALDLADWSSLQDRASVTVFSDTVTDPDELVERLQPFAVLCVMREGTPLPGGILRRLPHLGLIVSTGPKPGCTADLRVRGSAAAGC